MGWWTAAWGDGLPAAIFVRVDWQEEEEGREGGQASYI